MDQVLLCNGTARCARSSRRRSWEDGFDLAVHHHGQGHRRMDAQVAPRLFRVLGEEGEGEGRNRGGKARQRCHVEASTSIARLMPMTNAIAVVNNE